MEAEMKKRSHILAVILAAELIVIAVLAAGPGYTKSPDGLEDATLQAVAAGLGVSAESLTAADKLLYKDTVSFLVRTQEDRTVYAVWIRCLLRDSYKLYAVYPPSGDVYSFCAYGHFSEYRISAADGKLHYESSEIREDVSYRLFLAFLVAIVNILMILIRRKEFKDNRAAELSADQKGAWIS